MEITGFSQNAGLPETGRRDDSVSNYVIDDGNIESSDSPLIGHKNFNVSPNAVRILYINDKNYEARAQWLAGIFPSDQIFKYSPENTRAISSASYFNIVMVHGDDVPRISKIIRENSEAFAGKVKIAVCSRSWPPDRARLLNAGFDDIFDLRMDPLEARARVAALMRRRLLSQTRQAPPISQQLLIEMQGYVTSKLTFRETEIFAKLLEKRGQPVSIAVLGTSFRNKTGGMKKAALRVFLCRLRKKLKDNVQIVSENGVSYILKISGVLAMMAISVNYPTTLA